MSVFSFLLGVTVGALAVGGLCIIVAAVVLGRVDE